jgi:hypothetical protein
VTETKGSADDVQPVAGRHSVGELRPLVAPAVTGDRVTPSELILTGTVLAVIAGVLLGGHVLHGGLYTDDWPLAAIQAQKGTGGLISNLFLADHSRPIAAVYLGIVQAAIGTDGHTHAAVGLGLHVLMCWSLYWLLRTVGINRWHSSAITVLVLLFPFADSTWLWFAASHASLALAIAFLGGVATLKGLHACGTRSYVLEGSGAALYALSVMTYEFAAAAILLSVLVYAGHASRRAAITCWLVDVAAVGAVIAIPRLGVLPGEDVHQSISLSQQLEHARTIADQTLSVLTLSAVPFGHPPRSLVLPLLALIAVTAALVRASTPANGKLAAELRRAFHAVAAGVVIIAAAYVVFVNTTPAFYQPAAQGSDNRINALAAVGYCLFVYGLALLVGVLFMPRSPRTGAVAIASLATIFLAAGYVDRARQDVRAWDRAAAYQRSQLERLRRGLKKPPPQTTIFAFGGVGMTAPSVYAFRVTWDLDSAVQLLWRDETLHAYPVFIGTTIVCDPTSLYPNGPENGNGPAQRADYGRVVFFDFRGGSHRSIATRSDCLAARHDFEPGPVM